MRRGGEERGVREVVSFVARRHHLRVQLVRLCDLVVLKVQVDHHVVGDFIRIDAVVDHVAVHLHRTLGVLASL
ncbi:hypothetical protein BC937DRAFT_87664 [Endogone sp. FLAS-F59071]|nr:hypothetical protein BC937DRAFT_87664 [Endogone sp. FLAS-F59071]|eukprot:RUS19325.1 hypothetical protein BC937DRAFT_87664 [Endogone sp. FLAS-F59071]